MIAVLVNDSLLHTQADTTYGTAPLLKDWALRPLLASLFPLSICSGRCSWPEDTTRNC